MKPSCSSQRTVNSHVFFNGGGFENMSQGESLPNFDPDALLDEMLVAPEEDYSESLDRLTYEQLASLYKRVESEEMTQDTLISAESSAVVEQLDGAVMQRLTENPADFALLLVENPGLASTYSEMLDRYSVDELKALHSEVQSLLYSELNSSESTFELSLSVLDRMAEKGDIDALGIQLGFYQDDPSKYEEVVRALDGDQLMELHSQLQGLSAFEIEDDEWDENEIAIKNADWVLDIAAMKGDTDALGIQLGLYQDAPSKYEEVVRTLGGDQLMELHSQLQGLSAFEIEDDEWDENEIAIKNADWVKKIIDGQGQ